MRSGPEPDDSTLGSAADFSQRSPHFRARRLRERTATIVYLDLDKGLTEHHLREGYAEVLVVVRLSDRVIGQFFVEWTPRLSVARQWQLIARHLGDLASHLLVRDRLEQLRGPVLESEAPAARIAVVVCTRRRPEQLASCLASIERLHADIAEVIVVDNSGGDPPTKAVVEEAGAFYVHEPIPGQTRARNRGLLSTNAEFVAFTDDDCVVDAHWLDHMDRSFADPLTMAVTGYIGALTLEKPAQFLFERHGGFERHARVRIFDVVSEDPLRAAAIAGAGANMIFRREVFAELGNFAEDLGPGTPARSSDDKYQFYKIIAAGYRVRYEPSRRVSHRHREDFADLRRIFNDYGVAEFAYTTRCLLRHRELAAFGLWRWWIGHFAGEVRDALLPGRSGFPITLTWEEVRGAVRGPSAMAASQRSRRALPPLRAPRGPLPEGRSNGISVRRDDPSLSIALASYNRRERLRKTLLALAEQRLPAQQFEVNLVLDGSTDGSAEMCRGIDLPFKLTVHQQENRGLAASRNQGARMAAHNLVLFLDDDIELSAGGLLAHAKAHGASRDAHMALGYYPPALEAKSLWAIVVRNWWEDHFRRKADSPRAWHFTDVVDGNSSIPKDLFFRLGGFDERFRGGRRQDYEFGIRLLRAGVHIGYYRRALGHHFFDARVETAFRNSRDEGRYDALTAQIHPSVATQLPLVRVAALLRRPRFARAAFHRTVGHVPSEVVLPLLRSLETSNARGKWMALMNRTLLRSYALGAIEFWGGLEAALEHLRPLLAQTRPALRVPIDGSTFPLGPTVEATDVEISLYGRSVGAVRAIPPGAQWDWDDFLDRAADELTESLKLEALASALSGDPS